MSMSATADISVTMKAFATTRTVGFVHLFTQIILPSSACHNRSTGKHVGTHWLLSIVFKAGRPGEYT